MRNRSYKRHGHKKWVGLFLLMIFFSVTTIGQVKISGAVTNEKGEGLPGASITVKNENAGTSTNADGSYQLNADLKAGKKAVNCH